MTVNVTKDVKLFMFLLFLHLAPHRLTNWPKLIDLFSQNFASTGMAFICTSRECTMFLNRNALTQTWFGKKKKKKGLFLYCMSYTLKY